VLIPAALRSGGLLSDSAVGIFLMGQTLIPSSLDIFGGTGVRFDELVAADADAKAASRA
jgi:hypothetical protein